MRYSQAGASAAYICARPSNRTANRHSCAYAGAGTDDDPQRRAARYLRDEERALERLADVVLVNNRRAKNAGAASPPHFSWTEHRTSARRASASAVVVRAVADLAGIHSLLVTGRVALSRTAK